MQNTPISTVDSVALSAAAQSRSDDDATAASAAASQAESNAIAVGQAVTSVSQNTRRLVDIFA